MQFVVVQDVNWKFNLRNQFDYGTSKVHVPTHVLINILFPLLHLHKHFVLISLKLVLVNMILQNTSTSEVIGSLNEWFWWLWWTIISGDGWGLSLYRHLCKDWGKTPEKTQPGQLTRQGIELGPARWRTDGQTERQRDRVTDRQRDRLTDRQRDRQTDRQTDRETDRQRDRQTERQTYRETDIQRDRHTERHTYEHWELGMGGA